MGQTNGDDGNDNDDDDDDGDRDYVDFDAVVILEFIPMYISDMPREKNPLINVY